MNNILIPTDFTANSVKLAEQALQHVEGRKVNIILFHAFSLPFHTIDLLSPSPRQPYQDLLNDGFRQACKQLKDQYPKEIGKITFRCLNGNTNAAFRNFIDANDIDMIVCPESYVYEKIHKLSIDPHPLFRKSGIPVLSALKPAKKEVTYNVKTIQAPELAMQ